MSRNPQRISEVLDLIEAIWRKYPDLRLCQILDNIHSKSVHQLYYIEDDELYRLLCEIYPLEEKK